MTKQEKAKEIIKRLEKAYPNPKTALYYKTPLDLLVATMLSAQTTDKLVNTITPTLFNKYKTAKDYAYTTFEELNDLIKKVNFHNNKTKNIIATAKILHDKYGDRVPDTLEELDALPGVARKTANVVLGTIHNKTEGIVVDTHVMRLSRRLELTNQKDPVKIEQDLMEIVPKEKWIEFSHLLINFGREYCPARPHKCPNCPLGDLCPDQ